MFEDDTDNFIRTREKAENFMSCYAAEYMNKVFSKMCIGILITFAAALGLNVSGLIYNMPCGAFIGVLIGQLVLVLVMNVLVGNMNISKTVMSVCYAVYCALTGVTAGILLAVFTAESVVNALLATALLFAALAFTGYRTGKDLSSVGSVCLAGLIVCIILSLVNIFIFHTDMLYILIDAAVVVIFCGLTMYDVQKLKAVFFRTAAASNIAYEDDGIQKEFVEKIAVIGAFTLYLDFINLFIRLLSLFGKRK